MEAFLWMAEEWWGNHLVRGQLEEVGLIDTPDPQPYLGNQQTEKTFPTLEEEVTPKAGAKYIQTSIMIPHSTTFARAIVVSCKCNAEKNLIGCAHGNPILDSCVYDVELLTAKAPPSQPMPSPKPCMPSVTLMEKSISSWMNSLA